MYEKEGDCRLRMFARAAKFWSKIVSAVKNQFRSLSNRLHSRKTEQPQEQTLESGIDDEQMQPRSSDLFASFIGSLSFFDLSEVAVSGSLETESNDETEEESFVEDKWLVMHTF